MLRATWKGLVGLASLPDRGFQYIPDCHRVRYRANVEADHHGLRVKRMAGLPATDTGTGNTKPVCNGAARLAEDPEKTNDDRKLEERLSSLDRKLSERRGEQKVEAGASSKSGMSGFGNALRLSSEFIAAILVGALIGYLIDTFAGTSPWGMIIFLLLGFVAGVVNVLRASGEMADPYKDGWAKSAEEKNRIGKAGRPDDL